MLRRVSLGIALAALACLTWAEPDPALVQRLREGGYVLYMRHASTDMSRNDSGMSSYEDCENQRNLTDKGREEARAIGAHIERLRIPIGDVLASPYCRTMETARLAFRKARATSAVRGGPVEASRYEALRKLLSESVTKGEKPGDLQSRQPVLRPGRRALSCGRRDRGGAARGKCAVQRGREDSSRGLGISRRTRRFAPRRDRLCRFRATQGYSRLQSGRRKRFPHSRAAHVSPAAR